ncbi:MAG: ABC transporter ATP-binding protein [Candidatus Micrarchaeia archaeon]|jgi:energy-coupling factor transport system ATP-binding protein
MAKKEVLRLESVSFSYAGKKEKAVGGTSLAFYEGEFAGIIGPVGSGKTTLLYCCNGLVPKEIRGTFSGSVQLLGKDASRMGFPEISRAASMVFQDPNDQIFNLTVEEEVAFGLLNRGVRREDALAAAGRAVARVGLAEKLHEDPSELSSGQKQKVAIACALAADSRIILLDEPVSSLDWRSSQEVYAMLGALAREGRTVIATEQDTSLLARHATRIIVVEGGKVVKDGGLEVLSSGLIGRLGLRPPMAEKGKNGRTVRP